MQPSLYEVNHHSRSQTRRHGVFESNEVEIDIDESSSRRRYQNRSLCYKLIVFCSVFRIQDWISSKSYIAFRYSMVFLYIGTMLVVLGYHNAWLNFVKYVGLGLVIVGSLSICIGLFDFCSKCYKRRSVFTNPELYQGHIQTVSSRVATADSKKGLPSYDIVAGYELPTYEEAEELRLYPGKIPEEYFRRLSIVQSNSTTEGIRNPDDGTIMQLPVFPGNYFAQLENQTGLQILVRSQDEEFEDVSDNRLNQRPKIHVENFEHSDVSSTSSGLPEDFSMFVNQNSTIHSSQTYSNLSRRQRRSSELSQVYTTENEEDVLRRLRQTISARPQTSRLQYPSVLESDEESIDECEISDLANGKVDSESECKEADWEFNTVLDQSESE